MYNLWNYLFDLAINFEHPESEGEEFLAQLAGADGMSLAEFQDEDTPVADISVDNSFQNQTGERS